VEYDQCFDIDEPIDYQDDTDESDYEPDDDDDEDNDMRPRRRDDDDDDDFENGMIEEQNPSHRTTKMKKETLQPKSQETRPKLEGHPELQDNPND
jgi:hypothetical protein